MLRVALHWVVSRHQLVMGNDFGSPAIPDKKWFFHVCMAHSAGLVRCMSGGGVLEVSMLGADKFHCPVCRVEV
jgi:hypothetical protein